jgi:HSP20 family protein
MFKKLSSEMDIAIQKAVAQARDTNFFKAGTTGRGVYPFINLFEKEGNLVLAAELPGVKKESLTLEIREDVLRLAGTRRVEYGEDCSCHRMERKGVNFDRSIRLPFPIEGDRVEAELKNGVLQMSLPRAESDKPKKIVIK